MSVAADALEDLACPAQLCCSVLDSIGGAESYSVSVSWVGSPANVQGFDSVPAPQSQKNLRVRFENEIIQKQFARGRVLSSRRWEPAALTCRVWWTPRRVLGDTSWCSSRRWRCGLSCYRCDTCGRPHFHLFTPHERPPAANIKLCCEYDCQKLPVKIMHWVAGVAWNLVQALTSAHSLFNGILIVHYSVIWSKERGQSRLKVRHSKEKSPRLPPYLSL